MIFAKRRFVALSPDIRLFQDFRRKRRNGVIFYAIADLNRVAADFAILHIRLAPDRKIQNHRDLFTAVWASEEVFHRKLSGNQKLFLDDEFASHAVMPMAHAALYRAFKVVGAGGGTGPILSHALGPLC